MIDGVEVEIGEELAGEVTDRQAPGPPQWCEQSVAGEGIDGRASAGSIGQDHGQQPAGVRADDRSLQLGRQEPVINGGKVESDISLEHPGVFAAGSMKPAQRTVAAVTLAIGMAGGDEMALQRRGDHGNHGMVHHPIAERCGTHQAGLGFTNGEVAVGARCVGAALQLVLELKEFSLQIGAKGEHIGSVALALAGLAEGRKQCGKGRDAGVEIRQGIRAGGVAG